MGLTSLSRETWIFQCLECTHLSNWHAFALWRSRNTSDSKSRLRINHAKDPIAQNTSEEAKMESGSWLVLATPPPNLPAVLYGFSIKDPFLFSRPVQSKRDMVNGFLGNASSAGCCVYLSALFVNDVTSLFAYTRAGRDCCVLRAFYNHLSPRISHMMDWRVQPWISLTPGIHHFTCCVVSYLASHCNAMSETGKRRFFRSEGAGRLQFYVRQHVAYSKTGKVLQKPSCFTKVWGNRFLMSWNERSNKRCEREWCLTENRAWDVRLLMWWIWTAVAVYWLSRQTKFAVWFECD